MQRLTDVGTPANLRGGDLLAGLGALAIGIALTLLTWYSFSALDVQEITPGTAQPGLTPEGAIFGENTATGQTFQFTFGDESAGAWEEQELLGTLANAVVIMAGLAALGIALARAADREVSRRLELSAALLAAAAVVAVVLRMIFPVASDSELKIGIYVALAGTLALAAGRVAALFRSQRARS